MGLILIPGPGLNPKYLLYGDLNAIISGYVDHRGNEVQSISESEVREVLQRFKKEGISNLAVVGKFSIRNPGQELQIARLAGKEFKVTTGHSLSGSLNFPRRVVTTCFNAGTAPIHQQFIQVIKDAFTQRGIRSPVLFLKSDGGTIPVDESLVQPEEISRQIEKTVARLQQIWQERDDVDLEQVFGNIQKYYRREKNIFYDTDGINEEQTERVRYCSDCPGYLLIDSRASRSRFNDTRIFAVSIPRLTCNRCHSEARNIFEEQTHPRRNKYDYIYLQDLKEDEYLRR